MPIINEYELEGAAGGANNAQTFKYTIVYGDTLFGIAKRFGTTVKTLQELNGIQNPDKIGAGAIINVPVLGKKGWI